MMHRVDENDARSSSKKAAKVKCLKLRNHCGGDNVENMRDMS